MGPHSDLGILDALIFGPDAAFCSLLHLDGATPFAPATDGAVILEAGGSDLQFALFGAQVPEPASVAMWALIGLGLIGFGFYRTRRKR